MKTILVLGGAYGGSRAAQVLAAAAGILEDWRILLVDRNTHVNHVYVLPRLSVLPGHEHKAFIPFKNIFKLEPNRANPHCIHLQASVVSLHKTYVVISKTFPEYGIESTRIEFEYLVYALGSRLPVPLDLWGSSSTSSSPGSSSVTEKHTEQGAPGYGGTKAEGIEWLKRHQEGIGASRSVLVVGGGALGIQFATDIKAIYPEKEVTLVHSRERLLPRFEKGMHDEILESLESFNVEVILGERLDMGTMPPQESAPDSDSDSRSRFSPKDLEARARGEHVVRTVNGREIKADLILLCTGQIPNTHFLKEMDPLTVNQNDSLAHVLRTMQLGVLPPKSNPNPSLSVETEKETALDLERESESNVANLDLEQRQTRTGTGTPYPNIFVIGDCADAFGAIDAGHTAYFQGEVAARNILRLIKRERERERLSTSTSTTRGSVVEDPLEHYTPGLPAIKVSLGLTKSVYQSNGVVGIKNDGKEDLDAEEVWPYFGVVVRDESEMYE